MKTTIDRYNNTGGTRTKTRRDRPRRLALASSAWLSIILLSIAGSIALSSAFVVTVPTARPLVSSSVFLAAEGDSDLLERARKLREEASLLEDDLRATNPKAPLASEQQAPVVANTQLEGSVWTVSYRFSSQPAPKDDNTDNDAPPKIFYSGKLDILLKADGYSERIIRVPPTDGAAPTNDIEITKIWGWDRETSSEDDLDYLLLSMDVRFPESDPDAPDPKKTERYYLQARIESDGGGGLALKDGTITVKKDLTEKTGGMWGLFNVAGILTEFRYCGDFAARPAAR